MSVSWNIERPTVLIVDDTPENLAILGELLEDHYRVRAVNSGARALRAMQSGTRPDIVLLDIMMPEMDGYEVLKRLKADAETADIPVIFITAMTTTENEAHGLALGAVDYITKPFSPAIVQARVRAQLELKQARDRLQEENAWLDREVARRMRENELVRELSTHSLAMLAELRDMETGLHIMRTQHFVEQLGQVLIDHPRFAPQLANDRLSLIVRAAPLHDVGKVGIPDAILKKPGKLTREEWAVMQSHAKIGADAIARSIDAVKLSLDASGMEHALGALEFMEVAREIALSHHEKWDGSGYPQGLQGDAIPVAGRLMALADVFDALVCRRVYKDAFSFDSAIELIEAGRGKHFDPAVVDAFKERLDTFIEISLRLADQQP